jgi:uncharacterized SAM-binding protein YcdF (DUF218 family)
MFNQRADSDGSGSQFRKRLIRAVLAVAALCGALSGISSGEMLGGMSWALEARFSRAQIGNCGDITGIVVLGGGDERLREAGRLARRFEHLHVFVTGAGAENHVLSTLGRGIAAHRVEIEYDAKSTFENALNSYQTVRPHAGERWLLVTSASHMPRSIGAFRKAGFDIEAWPVYDLTDDNQQIRHRVAVHELLGLGYYWVRGRSASLLPGPVVTPAASRSAGPVGASVLSSIPAPGRCPTPHTQMANGELPGIVEY